MPKMVSATQARAGLVSQPTPDGGASSQTAGMTIQNNWEALRDSGMSAADATSRLHHLSPQMSGAVAGGGGPSPWWAGGSRNSDPNQAVMTGPTIPNTVRAPDTSPAASPSILDRAVGAIWDPS